MLETVAVPVWLLIIVALLAGWLLAERLLLPGVRWFFRRRINAVIEKLNQRLKIRLPTFSLTKRRVLIDRLIYDPEMMAAVRTYCDRTGTPWDAALARVERYAREIVPSLNAYLYLGVANLLARQLIRRFYRVRFAHMDRLGSDPTQSRTSIVFVINHRSNMDYVLVAYVALKHTVLSYAAGEWARTWPLGPLVRALGGYFVRRESNDELYRRTLERYVQMAVDADVVQAVFPEGGLSRDGAFRRAKIGLLDYMLRNFEPSGSRDILFVPVAVNYDWVMEDRKLLVAGGHKGAERTSMLYALGQALGYLGRRLRRRMQGEWYRMGYAVAAFGEPVSARQWCREQNVVMPEMPREERLQATQRFAEHVMQRVSQNVPATPVPIVCESILRNPDRVWTRGELQDIYRDIVARIDEVGAYVPRRRPAYGVELALRILLRRGLIAEQAGGYRMIDGERPVLAYYANSIRPILGDHASSAHEPSEATGTVAAAPLPSAARPES